MPFFTLSTNARHTSQSFPPVVFKRKTQSKFVKERLAKNVDMFSNGETSMRYFTEHIDRDAVYLPDEPENSLSIK